MECAICFHEVQKFKVLTCGHFFCEDCLTEIAGGRVTLVAAAQTDLKSAGSEEKPEISSRDTLTREFECPKCRKNTSVSAEKGVNTLRSKFVGDLHCFQCDERKPVGEFRWCHSCFLSVCSSCFVDKHSSVSEDGVLSLHTASKWEDYKAVEFCLGQIKLQTRNSEKIVGNSKEYLRSYLAGLEEFLCHDLEMKSRSGYADLEKDAKKLAEAFGIAWEQIPIAREENMSFQYVLPELIRLSGLDFLGKARFSENGTNVHINSVPYPEISRHLLSSEKRPFEPIWFDARVFRQKAKETFVLGGNLIKQPSDLCLISEDILLISDYENGIFLFKNQCLLQGPIPLNRHTSYRNYARMAKMPVSASQSPAMVLVNVQHTNWSFLIIKLTPDGVEQEKIGGSTHWSLPSNKNVPLSSSERNLFAVSSRTLWKFGGMASMSSKSESWKEVHVIAQENPHHYHRLGPVLERESSSDVVLLNTVWSSVDIVSVSHDDKFWGVRRIEIGLTIGPKCLRELREPLLVKLSPDGSKMMLADKLTSKLFLWSNFGSSGGQNQVHDLFQFAAKTPQAILYDSKHRIVFQIMQHGDHNSVRCFEMVQM